MRKVEGILFKKHKLISSQGRIQKYINEYCFELTFRILVDMSMRILIVCRKMFSSYIILVNLTNRSYIDKEQDYQFHLAGLS